MFRKKNKIDFSKEPELTIDGQEIKFHYSRKERLGMLPEKREKTTFFDKGNRHIHILIIDIILILLVGAYLSTRAGRSREYEENGVKYNLQKKYFTKGKTMRFSIQVKNDAGETRVLDDVDMIFKVINRDKKEEFYSREILLSRQTYRPEEFSQEIIIIDKPPRGKYHATVWIDDEGNKSVGLNFLVR
jgi:hypothetical protein